MLFSKKIWTISSAMLVAGAVACPFCQPQKTGLFIGETAIMGNGTIRSWIMVGKNERPESIGVTFTGKALTGLKDAPIDKMGGEFVLGLPKAAKFAPFDHISVDWMPSGHAPAPIYGVPHLDFHFYIVPTSERSKMKLQSKADIATHRKPLPKGMLPKEYINPPEAEFEFMGTHHVDVTSPELSGKPFAATFIYGSYDSKMVFLEPMIAKSSIDLKKPIVAKVKPPLKVQKTGLYPTEYALTYDEVRDEYSMSLRKFVYLKASR